LKQVVADDAAKKAAEKKLLEEQIRLCEIAKAQYAEMQLSEEVINGEMQRRNPTCLSVAVRRRERVDTWAESNDGEEFNFDGVDNMSSSDSEVVVQPVRKRKVNYNPWHTSWTNQQNLTFFWTGS
jgi:hypothetical protein